MAGVSSDSVNKAWQESHWPRDSSLAWQAGQIIIPSSWVLSIIGFLWVGVRDHRLAWIPALVSSTNMAADFRAPSDADLRGVVTG